MVTCLNRLAIGITKSVLRTFIMFLVLNVENHNYELNFHTEKRLVKLRVETRVAQSACQIRF